MMGHDWWLKPIVHVLLMPLVGVSYILVRTSLAVTILVGFLVIISAISFYMVIYRRRKISDIAESSQPFEKLRAGSQ